MQAACMLARRKRTTEARERALARTRALTKFDLSCAHVDGRGLSHGRRRRRRARAGRE